MNSCKLILVTLDTVWFHCIIYALKNINNPFVVTQQLVFHLSFLSNQQRQKSLKIFKTSNLKKNIKRKKLSSPLTQSTKPLQWKSNLTLQNCLRFDVLLLFIDLLYVAVVVKSKCTYYRSELRYSDKSGLFILTVSAGQSNLVKGSVCY